MEIVLMLAAAVLMVVAVLMMWILLMPGRPAAIPDELSTRFAVLERTVSELPVVIRDEARIVRNDLRAAVGSHSEMLDMRFSALDTRFVDFFREQGEQFATMRKDVLDSGVKFAEAVQRNSDGFARSQTERLNEINGTMRDLTARLIAAPKDDKDELKARLDDRTATLVALTSSDKMHDDEMPPPDPLSAEDRAFLLGLGYPWRLVQEWGAWALVLTGYRLPDAFTPQAADIMVRIPALYPMHGLDMFNFHPPLARRDGRPLDGISNFSFGGEQWQQWSRHRLQQTPWNPDRDGVASHFWMIKEALLRDAA
jgi:hypothetical protein